MPGFGAGAAAAGRGRAEPRRTSPRRCTSTLRRAAASSGRTSPATRSAPGSALEMGRDGWAASVTALSPAGLWRRAARPAPRATPQPWARRLRPLVSLALRLRRPRERDARRPSPPTPSGSRPAAGRELVLGWIDAERLRRRQPGDAHPPLRPERLPGGRPGDDRLGRARPPGRPAEARAPARRGPLPRPARRRPHADLGRPRAGRPHPARGQRSGAAPSSGEYELSNHEEERDDRREDREPAVAVERLPGRRRGRRQGGADRRQRRPRAAARAGRARRDRDHPHPRHPPPRSTTSPGSPRRASSSAARRWSPTPRRRPRSTRRSTRRSATARSSTPAASRSRRSTPPATPPATSPSSSTAPTSSPPTSSSRARSAGRWRPAPAASTTSGPR